MFAADYDVVLCDVWGVVHNSVVAFTEACTALTRFRRQGGTVFELTAPRSALPQRLRIWGLKNYYRLSH